MMGGLTQNQRLNLLGLVMVGIGLSAIQFIMADGYPSRFEFAAIIGVLLCWPILIRWSNGFFIFFTVLPFVSLVRRIYLMVDRGVGSDPLVLIPDVMFLLTATGYFLFHRGKDSPADQKAERQLKMLMLFFVTYSVMQIFNPYMNSVVVGINGFRQFTMYIAFALFTPCILTSRESAWRWVKIIALTSAFSGLYGSYQSLIGLPYYDALWQELAGVSHQVIGSTLRAFSTFGFTSTFSHYCVVGILAAVALSGANKVSFNWRISAPLLGLATTSGLALTFVRSSYLGLLIAGVLTLVMAGPPRARLMRMAGVLVVGGVLVAFLPQGNGEGNVRAAQEASATQLVTDRALSLSSSTQSHSYNYRIGLWTGIVRNSLNYPFGFGLGVGAGGKVGGSGQLQSFAYSESQVFSVLAELGWAGLLSFLALCGGGLLYTLKIHDQSQNESDKRLLRFSFGVQVGLFIVGISGGPVLYTLPGAPCYWAAVGLSLAVGRWQRREAALVAHGA